MRRLLIFSVFAIVGTGFWLLDYEGHKEQSQAKPKPQHSSESKVSGESFPVLAEEEDADDFQQHGITEIQSIPFELNDLELGDAQLSAPKQLLVYDEWSRKPEFREVKNINPPIKGVDPPSQAVVVPQHIIEEGGILNLGFGAFLHLPANSLVDEYGQAINEPVKISYCQLSDPIDIFLSGVPMNYDSAGSSETFRTAGMVRLEASTYSGKQVALKQGSTMRLDMPTVDEADDYNFYEFNEDRGAWEYSSTAPSARPAIDLILDTADFAFDFDIKLFDEKFKSLDYHFLVNRETVCDKNWAARRGVLISRTERAIFQALYGTKFRSFNYVQLRPFVETIGYDEKYKPIKELRFRVRTVGHGSRYFRELKHFFSTSLAIQDCESIQEFYKKYVRGRRFNDVRVEYEKGDEYCTLFLKDDKEIVKIKARLTSGPRPDVPLISKVRFFLNHYRYERDLSKKREAHDSLILKRKRLAYEEANSNMIRNANLSYMGSNGQYRSLNLQGFATYNCDQVARMYNPQPIARYFENEQGEKLSRDNIVVCDMRVRATFYFYNTVIPNCSKDGLGFMLLTQANKTYYLNSANWDPSNPTCAMKELPDVEDAAELRKILMGKG